MAHDIILLIAHYGLLLVFFNVLVEQAGVPVPALPTLVVAGALSATDRLPVVAVVAAAVLACLLSDSVWFWAGRHFGGGVMRTICRISLSPDSCVKQSELRFQRWRGRMLLVAKFIPGLSTVAPPLVGALGLGGGAFLLLDAAGSLLWVGLAVAAGWIFAAQIDVLLAALASASTVAFEVVLVLLALYIVAKWWQRRRLLHTLRMARTTVEALNESIVSGHMPLVVDVRSDAARLLDNRVIPGALLVDLDHIASALSDISIDRELVIYCSCPNEVSAAKAAKVLMGLGYHHVRPLLGGLDAWNAAGYAIERLPSAGDVAAGAVIRATV